ncbi:MAG: hypothetical protein GYB50_11695 [Rhodobacteraceae bacterium]|uniref:helix-turn-helix transcriptional regulator n=1 Tax=Salipiger thiooxidans TaxID=282683 RepID=UPI001A8C428B|nr:hypothetical protein [Salipiger thiooxidans]MBN8189203.1 hypothetical protein [Salipiger thiooxidans]MBR9838542.1 hypothetical protein [Paracoccaceae bacterium]
MANSDFQRTPDEKGGDRRMKASEVAILSGLHIETLYRWRREETAGGEVRLPPWHEKPIGSGRIFFWESDVLRWLSQRS